MGDNDRFANYEVLRRDDGSLHELGRGGMGVTYKARDTDLHCDVALKIIKPGLLDSAASERFLREARAAAQLRHPNIASVFRLGQAGDGTHFYAMEFCAGPTVDQAIAARGPFPAEEALHLAWQICKALMLAEQHQLLHRDLKPSNLILTNRSDEGMVVKVIDFGLAKSLADGRQTLAMPSTAGFVGTAHFASPEQLEEQPLDVRSDLYSLGACLWFMLTGRPVFEGSVARVVNLVLSAEPPWQKLAGQPPSVVALLRRLLARDRDARPSTATELRKDLEACLQTLKTKPTTPLDEFPTVPRPATLAPMSEEEFSRRYPMRERIGRDRFGRIFEARDSAHGGRAVAVRVFDPALADSPAMRRELEAQCAAARAHPHPHVRATLDFSASRQGLLVAMEWTDGFSIEELLGKRHALSAGEMLSIIEPLAEATDHALRHRLTTIGLTREQVVVHFPQRPSMEERSRLLTAPLGTWPEHVIKAAAISMDADPSEGVSNMMTLPPGVSPERWKPAADPIGTLARLSAELLGWSGRGNFNFVTPVTEAAKSVFRLAMTRRDTYPSAAAFVEALRRAMNGPSPSYRPQELPPIPASPQPPAPESATAVIASPPSTTPAASAAWRWGGAALAGIAVIAIVAGQSIHVSRIRADERRRAAEEHTRQLAEQQRLAAEEAARIRAEADRVKAEAEKAREAARFAAERTAALEKEKAAAARPAPAPAEASPGSSFPDALLERDEITPSGNLRIKYWISKSGDGKRRITIESHTNPADWSVLFDHQRSAKVVISPNDQWLALNDHPGSSGGGAQLYRQVSIRPPRYEVPPDFRGEGRELQDRIWSFYLGSTNRKPDSDRDHVHVDAIDWDHTGAVLLLRISSHGSNAGRSVPTAWDCSFDVETQNARAISPSNNIPAAPPVAVKPLPGERFPQTRTQFLKVSDIHRLSDSELRYAINEMFARHGADFRDKLIKKQFAKCVWYRPKAGLTYDQAELAFNPLEAQNLKVLGALRDLRNGQPAQFPAGTNNVPFSPAPRRR